MCGETKKPSPEAAAIIRYYWMLGVKDTTALSELITLKGCTDKHSPKQCLDYLISEFQQIQSAGSASARSHEAIANARRVYMDLATVNHIIEIDEPCEKVLRKVCLRRL